VAESAKKKQSIESFKQFLSEAIKDKEAIHLGEDGDIYLAGVVGIVQEVTQGLLPLYLSRTLAQAAMITRKLKAKNINYLTIFSNKHNLTDDEPRGEQMLFEWGYSSDFYPDKTEWLNLDNQGNGPIMIKSSFSLVGKIRHRGWPLS
jgi:hypothetical protein